MFKYKKKPTGEEYTRVAFDYKPGILRLHSIENGIVYQKQPLILMKATMMMIKMTIKMMMIMKVVQTSRILKVLSHHLFRKSVLKSQLMSLVISTKL